MAFSRGVSVSTTVAHATTVTGADDPTKEINKDQWNGTAAHTVVASGSETVVDAISGGIPYFSSTTAEGTSALLAANALVIGGGAGTAPFTSANLTFGPTAGQGLSVAAGTATTDVNAIGATQTWNASGVSFRGLRLAITDTASANGSNAVHILGGASATTDLFRVTKTGALFSGANINIPSASGYVVDTRFIISSPSDGNLLLTNSGFNDLGRVCLGGTTSAFPSIKRSGTTMQSRLADDSAFAPFTASAYNVGATAGASFGPGMPTSMTIVNGIVTAAS